MMIHRLRLYISGETFSAFPPSKDDLKSTAKSLPQLEDYELLTALMKAIRGARISRLNFRVFSAADLFVEIK